MRHQNDQDPSPQSAGPRLAYLTSQYPASSHTFIMREILALRRRGLDVHSFSVRPPSIAELGDSHLATEAAMTWTILAQPHGKIAADHIKAFLGRPVAYLRLLLLASRHRAPGLKSLFLALAHFGEAVVLARELKRRGIRRLHNHFANSAATVGFLACEFQAIPWSFTMHGISETDYPSCTTLAKKIASADRIICASKFMRAQAMRVCDPMHWGKMRVIHCGIPVLEIAQLPDRQKRGKNLICVARLSPEKGLPGLLEVFAAVLGLHPKCRLRLVGDGPDLQSLKDQAKRLGIEDNVEFLGRRSERDTLALIRKSDILVLASFMEGLPVVLMEAMAAGTPVVASQVAGIPELVSDGISGLLFAASDWEALRVCLLRLLDDTELGDRLAENASQKVTQEFDIEKSADELARLYGGSTRSATGP